MTHHKFTIIIAFLLPYFGLSQAESPLSQLLWDNVATCASNFEDKDNGYPDAEIVDDSKNGYLSISGSYPTCGCYCESTIGAYKDTNGNYTLLQSNYSTCDWTKETTSNKNLETILPKDFGLESFTSKTITSELDYPIFFIEADIPQKGTDTKVKLKLVPFGLQTNGNDIICYDYSEANFEHLSYYFVIKIAQTITNETTLDLILSGNFNAIEETDLAIINKNIEAKNFESKTEIQDQLTELKNVYDAYLQIEHAELLLGWNRETAKFYIKEKGEKPKAFSFREFLLNHLYWTPMC